MEHTTGKSDGRSIEEIRLKHVRAPVYKEVAAGGTLHKIVDNQLVITFYIWASPQPLLSACPAPPRKARSRRRRNDLEALRQIKNRAPQGPKVNKRQ